MPKRKHPEPVINEWSHFVNVDDLGDSERRLSIEPNAQQIADLTRRLGIDALQSLSADVTISPAGGGIIHVTGTLRAEVAQTCVVTLEPMRSVIEEAVEGWFSDQDQMVSFAKVKKDQQVRKAHAEVEVLSESEDPEAVVDGRIDVGELVTQHLSLAIDPYPHKEGVAHEYTDENTKTGQGSGVRRNPFEALKDWKEKR